jgi:GNAT superfamily N-acetyltransferase
MPSAIPIQGRNSKIYPVTRERWRDLERLFGPKGAYSNCWCMFWRVRRRDFHALAPEKRKAALRAWVRSGAEPGLLAYRRGEPVAWCAVAPRDEYAALAASPKLQPIGDTAGVWSITCYYVPKEQRRTGLMSALLGAAARHARRKGGRLLEGYPVIADSLSGCMGYTGLVPAYRRAGFRVVARPSRTMRVMQKALR